MCANTRPVRASARAQSDGQAGRREFVVGDTMALDEWFEDCLRHPEGCPRLYPCRWRRRWHGRGACRADRTCRHADHAGFAGGGGNRATGTACATASASSPAVSPVTPTRSPGRCASAPISSSAPVACTFRSAASRRWNAAPAAASTGVTSAEPRLIAGLDPADKAVRAPIYDRTDDRGSGYHRPALQPGRAASSRPITSPRLSAASPASAIPAPRQGRPLIVNAPKLTPARPDATRATGRPAVNST